MSADGDEAAPFIRAKWMMDGATTLVEAAAMLELEARNLRALDADGWTLREPVEGDYGWLAPPPGQDAHPGEPT